MQQLQEQIRHALSIDERNRQQTGRRNQVSKLVAALTTREREVMDLLVRGKTNKEISLALGVTVPTVDKHRWKVLEKMHVDNVVELVRLLSEITG